MNFFSKLLTLISFLKLLVPVTRMYPYGDAAGDVTADVRSLPIKCHKLGIPDGGMALFRQRHTKLHVSTKCTSCKCKELVYKHSRTTLVFCRARSSR